MRDRNRVTMAVAAEESMGASKAVVAKATGHGMNNYFCLRIAAVTSFSP